MSNEPKPGEPWAFVAHKDGIFRGVVAANYQGVGKFLGSFAKSGHTITTVHSRDEYDKLLESLKP